MAKKKIYTLLVLTLLLFVCKGKAQLNIKIGYTGGFTNAPVINKVIDDFNNKYKFEKALSPFRSLHGIEIGLRYRINNLGFELSWDNKSTKSDVVGKLASGTTFQDKWFLSMTEYALGIENYIGKLGIGASIGYRIANIKTDVTGAPRKKREITSESGFTDKIYLIVQFPGEKVGIAFKPYVQFPLKSINVSAFDQELNVQLDNGYTAISPNYEKFIMYGISIVLYNGLQVK